MASKERETKFLDYTRDEFIEHILLVEAKLGRQEKRNEASLQSCNVQSGP